MGITGLLPFLENATQQCHISEFRGGTVAVDTYCWLHRGVNACVEQLALGKETDLYIKYCLKYVRMLLRYDIHPILVFDGKNLPAKAETEKKRRESRKKARQTAAELLRTGQTEKARSYLKQCIDVTPDMASAVIKACRELNVDCIVAPYEADAQLAFFSLKGVADVIITEDSDLMLFGCKKVMYKLDLYGNGQLVQSDRINDAMRMKPHQYSFEKFRFMCVLSGCDYLSSLSGIGLKKALKFVSLTGENNPQIFLDKIPRYLSMPHLQVTEEYKNKFMEALATFRHQTVYDPFKRRLAPLCEIESAGTDTKFCNNIGPLFDEQAALQIALGNWSPNNLKQLDSWDPAHAKGQARSIWSAGCSPFKLTIQQKSSEVVRKSVSDQGISEEKKLKEESRIKDRDEECMEKELSFYSRKPEPVEIIDDDTVELECESTAHHNTSNPFAKKNKLSKFQLTQTSDNNVVVKSRFFASVSDKAEELPISQGSNVENDMDMANTLDKKTASPEIPIEIEEDAVIEMKKSPKAIKRSNSGRCRSVGLKRKSSQQQTIHSFFSKMKKT